MFCLTCLSSSLCFIRLAIRAVHVSFDLLYKQSTHISFDCTYDVCLSRYWFSTIAILVHSIYLLHYLTYKSVRYSTPIVLIHTPHLLSFLYLSFRGTPHIWHGTFWSKYRYPIIWWDRFIHTSVVTDRYPMQCRPYSPMRTWSPSSWYDTGAMLIPFSRLQSLRQSVSVGWNPYTSPSQHTLSKGFGWDIKTCSTIPKTQDPFREVSSQAGQRFYFTSQDPRILQASVTCSTMSYESGNLRFKSSWNGTGTMR